MARFHMFTHAIFHACHLTQPSNRGEYGLSDTIDLPIQSGRTINAIGPNGLWSDIGYPGDPDEAERRLTENEEASRDSTESAPVDS